MRALIPTALALGLAALACRSEEPASMLGDEERASATRPGEDEHGDEEDGEEVEIPLSEVPLAVRLAAEAAVPGLVLEKAEREREQGVVLYDLEGRADGERVELEVTAGGEVREVERADDEDD